MVGVLLVYGIYSVCTIENMDIPVFLTGLLGVYLLLCAYVAIGLFMSSLTSYQIVAASGNVGCTCGVDVCKRDVAGCSVCSGSHLLVWDDRAF